MQLDVTPPLGQSDTDALHAALAATGLSPTTHQTVYASAWRRAAAREAVDAELAVDALGALAPQDTGRDAGIVEP